MFPLPPDDPSGGLAEIFCRLVGPMGLADVRCERLV
jgi:hypothetical protein